MVVVAHPGDETFRCGSTLLHAAASGAQTAVLCATRGEAGDPAPDSGVTVEALGAARERELHAAAALLGVSSVELLDYADSGMDGDAASTTLVGALFDDVIDEVRAALEQFKPHVVVTLDAADGHRDHKRIRDATLAAVDDMRWKVERVYLQTAPGTPDAELTTVIDSSEFLPQRERAVAAHASQVAPYVALPPDLYRDLLNVARLQRVRPPIWDGSELETSLF